MNESVTEEEFYDASEIFTNYHMSLQESIYETCLALQLFLNNKYNLAKQILKPHILNSIYHSLGYSTLLYLQAFMTFDTVDLDNANESLRISLEVCQKFRHKKSFTTSWGIRKNDFNKYSIEEVHAELCYAECILEKAMLTFIQDESLLSFVKGGMKIRTSYYCYKECQDMLICYPWNEADNFYTKSHFESGTRMGIGGFNLILANLPSRILKLLEFIGFSGNKEFGIRELELATFQDAYSLRSPLSAITLLVYHLFTTYILGSGDGDTDICQQILNLMLKYHPNGAIFLYFQARLYEVIGNFLKAIESFNNTISCQNEFKQIQYLCYWELMWCFAYDSNWTKAAHYSQLLSEGSKWSKSTYIYQRACFMMMLDNTCHQDKEIADLIDQVPLFKQRLAGKSVPVEKFVIKKCQRYKEQNNHLVAPAIEIMYIWNGFSILGKRKDYLEVILKRLDKEMDQLSDRKETDPFYHDNYCLIQLLKGICWKFLDNYTIASNLFLSILKYEADIKDDFYIIPYSLVELAFISIEERDSQNAIQYLEAAKLHFKIHSAFNSIEVNQETWNQEPSPDKSQIISAQPSSLIASQPILPYPPESLVDAVNDEYHNELPVLFEPMFFSSKCVEVSDSPPRLPHDACISTNHLQVSNNKKHKKKKIVNLLKMKPYHSKVSSSKQSHLKISLSSQDLRGRGDDKTKKNQDNIFATSLSFLNLSSFLHHLPSHHHNDDSCTLSPSPKSLPPESKLNKISQFKFLNNSSNSGNLLKTSILGAIYPTLTTTKLKNTIQNLIVDKKQQLSDNKRLQ
ncbi:tetratricopeptide repeat protein 39B-like isoform X2 [Gordionus sp. m RMFG-2023]|uniref:tetratricopeptide repeat protein 39B-like isoform X2 n=1 Tax=Gordionus sp. m RMFG-2023 TaxID=3053472 RepID=UPI0031FCFCC4